MAGDVIGPAHVHGAPAEGGSVAAVRDLDQMLGQMLPVLRSGRYVFTTPTGALPPTVLPVMTFSEDEGTTAILTQQEADELNLAYDVVLAWITLRVHSALDAVGLTATVSAALTNAGISCNVVAAAFHDHLFVPAESADHAVEVLQVLAHSRTAPL